jgi:hypothetical protein
MSAAEVLPVSPDVALDDPMVPRRHARFYRSDRQFYVEDLGSSNGTADRNRVVSAIAH